MFQNFPSGIAYTSGEYDPSLFHEVNNAVDNNEEESVITNGIVFNSLVDPAYRNLMERVTYGKKVTIYNPFYNVIKKYCRKCHPTQSWSFWIWQRNHDRLHGWENKLECDYVYEYLLKQ